jgi:Na+-translocating ferredoxin:NAD+ oxidoreductase RnfD subunit
VGILAAVISYAVFNRWLRYPQNPAVLGWLFLYFLFPGQMFPVGMRSMAALHPLVVYLTVAGGVALSALGYVKWRVALGVAAGTALGMAAVILAGRGGEGIGAQLMAGHYALAAFFLAPDRESSPVSGAGMVGFGIGVGVLAVAVQTFGPWPDAAPLAVALMSLTVPLLDRVRPRPMETSDVG